jgi:hypothetical protein
MRRWRSRFAERVWPGSAESRRGAAVSRVCRRANLKPWKVDTFKVINDTRFEKKLADIVGLALSPTSRLRRGALTRVAELSRSSEIAAPTIIAKVTRGRETLHQIKSQTPHRSALSNGNVGDAVAQKQDAAVKSGLPG